MADLYKMTIANDSTKITKVLQIGTKEEILSMLQYEVDLNASSENGDTPLHNILKNRILMEKDVIEILTLFLSRGIDPNIKNENEHTALHLVVERRMRNAVNLLLQFGADIHATDNCGISIAHFFIEDEFKKRKEAKRYPLMNTPENLEIEEISSVAFLEFLISKGLDFDYKDCHGDSALHSAMQYYLLHLLPTLLLNTKNKNKQMLLQLFLEESPTMSEKLVNSGRDSKYTAEIIQILLEGGAFTMANNEFSCKIISYTIIKNRGKSIIEILTNHYLIQYNNKNFAMDLYHELICLCTFWTNSDSGNYFINVLSDLLAQGASANDKSLRKKHMLATIEAKNARLLDFLNINGTEFNFKLEDGKTMLHVLAEQADPKESNNDFYEKLSYLLVRGDCELNVKDNFGRSPLYTAICHNNIPIARILLNLGAHVNCKDHNMSTLLHEALHKNASIELMGLLVTNGVDVNAADSKGETPLHLAVYYNNLAAVQLIIQYGSSTVIKNKNKQTPLHRISWSMDTAPHIIKILVLNGANINAKDYRDETPLQLALPHNKLSTIQSLIEHGAYVNCKDHNDQTPLHYAVMNTHSLEIVELLLASGAHVNAKDNEGNRPMHLVTKRSIPGSMDILKCLLNKGGYVYVRNNQGELPVNCAFVSDKSLLAEELLKYNENLRDSKIRQLLPTVRSNQEINLLLSKYRIKLAVANLTLDKEFKSISIDYDHYRTRCLNEIKLLKNTFIDEKHSLYEFLHMQSEQRYSYVSQERFKQLIEPAKLALKFPEYSGLIQSSNYEAIIMWEARDVINEVFFGFYKVSVECVVKKIVNYLKDEDFCVFES